MAWYTRMFEGLGKPIETQTRVDDINIVTNNVSDEPDEVVEYVEDLTSEELQYEFEYDTTEPETYNYMRDIKVTELLAQLELETSPREMVKLAKKIFESEGISPARKNDARDILKRQGITKQRFDMLSNMEPDEEHLYNSENRYKHKEVRNINLEVEGR